MSFELARNHRGSAVIETVVSLSWIGVVVPAGLIMSYGAFAKLWLDHAAYEALICLATESSSFSSTKTLPETCRSELRSKAEIILPWGKLTNLHLSRSSSTAKVALSFTVFGNLTVTVKDSLQLPLLGGPTIMKTASR